MKADLFSKDLFGGEAQQLAVFLTKIICFLACVCYCLVKLAAGSQRMLF